ncbi:MAG TPA: zf-HC2 domain-containing protein [Candidatus Limnocylindrales bacterium]|nr:zf-HC2 domain-containing protein [Candidatus Limnocylindrales bacterium]
MTSGEQNKHCAKVGELLVFYVCDEVSDEERTFIEKHLTGCADCQALLAEEKEFHGALVSLPRADEQLDSAGILLAQCRSELAEKLDDLEHPPVKQRTPSFGWVRRWMVLHPAWSAATLVLFGLVTGVQSVQWFAGRNNANALDAVDVRPSGPRLTDDQLSKMVVAGVNLTPSPYSGSQNVRVQLSAEQPVVLSGSLDDSDVREVLTYVVKNGERFDSGVRLDCLDALKARAEDAEVRAALLAAARKDQNPAVRLKALEALRNTAADDLVREALLQALKHDLNPGVRVEAVNLLVRSLETAPHDSMPTMPSSVMPALPSEAIIQAGSARAPADASMERVIRALEDLQRSDSSRYVRLRSAAALREISVRSDQ